MRMLRYDWCVHSLGRSRLLNVVRMTALLDYVPLFGLTGSAHFDLLVGDVVGVLLVSVDLVRLVSLARYA